MDDLAQALGEPGSSPAQLRTLLRAELDHGAQELARKR
jgi:hypothetical protein